MTMSAALDADDRARLCRIVAGLQVPHGFERSIKIRSGRVLANRCLLTIARASIGSDADRIVLDVCRRLNMPQSLVEPLTAAVGEASIVHFGFEEDAPERRFFKCYLEFESRFVQAVRENGDKTPPIEVHLAFKWHVTGLGEHAVAHYICHPRLDRTALLRRLAQSCAEMRNRMPWNVACELVAAADRRIDVRDLMYLEVSEDGTARRSFDLNVYRAGLPLAVLDPSLEALSAHFAVKPDDLSDALFERDSRTLGHIAAGVDRHGRDFFTIYFGVEAR